jgi:tetratricopeptide (TPR) repeat protein
MRGDQYSIFPLRSSWQAFLGSGGTGGITKGSTHEISLAGEEGAYRATAASDRVEGQRDALRFAAIESEAVKSLVDAHSHWDERAMEDFADGTARYLRNYATKLGIFWGPSEPPANLDMRFLSQYSFLLRTRAFAFPVLAALGLVGLVMGARRRLLHLAVFVPLTSVIASFYLISDTEKVLAVPFLCVFSGYLISQVWESIRNARPARAIACIAAAVGLGIVLQQAPKRDVDLPGTLVVVGDVYARVAIFEKAEESFKEAIEIDPDRPEPYVALADLYGDTGKPQMGIEVLESALRRGLDDPRLSIEKAALLLLMREPDGALSQLEDVRKTHPYEVRLHQLIGLAFLEKGDPERAAEQLRKELDYVGPGFITSSALGDAELELGNYEAAAEHLEIALSFNPNSSPAYVQLAEAYANMDLYLKACDVLGRVLTVDPGNMPIRFKLANYLFRAGRPQDALMHLRELHKYDPANADILVNLGTVYAEMDSLDRAIQVWKKALVLDPTNEMARDNLRMAEQEHE